MPEDYDLFLSQQKQKLSQHLQTFRYELRQQISESYYDLVDTFTDEIEAHYLLVLEDPIRESLQDFQKWFLQRLVEHEAHIFAGFSVWHEIIKPAFLGLVGIIMGIITLPVLPLSEKSQSFVLSFFTKPMRAEDADREVFHDHCKKAVEGIQSAIDLSTPG